MSQALKTIQIDDIVYVCAMYVVRAGDGWQVRMPRQKTVYFADGVHGGHEPAYLAAVAHRTSVAPITEQKRPLRRDEQKNKLRPTGVPGIFLSVKWRGPKAREANQDKQYYFRITGPGKLRTLYIGTESTWEMNYSSRLAKAVSIREEFTTGLLAS